MATRIIWSGFGIALIVTVLAVVQSPHAAAQTITVVPPIKLAPPCGKQSKQATLGRCLYLAAKAFRDNHVMTKWPGTECPGQPHTTHWFGHCACAASVQQVIKAATSRQIGTWGVDSFDAYYETGLPFGRINVVPDAKALPGDIIIWYTTDRSEGHIGFCATKKCTQTWSNSSALGSFAPTAHSISLDGYYPQHFIWRPGHIS
jgi:hypothetical protein